MVGPKVACESMRDDCAGVGWTTSEVVLVLTPHAVSSALSKAIFAIANIEFLFDIRMILILQL